MPRDDLTPPRAKMFKELDEMAAKHPEYADLAERVKAEMERLRRTDTDGTWGKFVSTCLEQIEEEDGAHSAPYWARYQADPS